MPRPQAGVRLCEVLEAFVLEILVDPARLPVMPVAGRTRIASGRPGPSSYLRQLARLNQVDEHVPLVLGQDRQIAGLTNFHLLSSELHFGARAAPGWAQQHLPILHSARLLPLMSVSRSM